MFTVLEIYYIAYLAHGTLLTTGINNKTKNIKIYKAKIYLSIHEKCQAVSQTEHCKYMEARMGHSTKAISLTAQPLVMAFPGELQGQEES